MTAVIFDLDGTLVDSAPDLHRAANALMAQVGGAGFDLADIKSFIGNGLPVLVQRIMAARGLATERYDELLADYRDFYESDPVALTRPYPGVAEAVGALASEAVLGVCTNKPEVPARGILTALGLIGRFDTIVGGDSLTVRKPDPAPLHLTCRRAGAKDCIFVGDSEIDAETAVRAGVPFVLFTEGYRKVGVDKIPHDASFSDFGELPEIIRRIRTR